MDAHYVRTIFQWFVSNPPRLSFKKLIVSTPRLLRNLHTMSLAKAAPDGLKDRECKKMALRKRPPFPYLPEKDSVQDTVSSYKDNHLKTLIKEGTGLRVLIWHSGKRKVFSFTWDLPKKRSRKRATSSPLRNIPKLTLTSARRSRN
jgi:hypothetical protein